MASVGSSSDVQDEGDDKYERSHDDIKKQKQLVEKTTDKPRTTADTEKCEETNEIRILLFGKTGAGKSALGNLMLRKTVFVSKMAGKSVTKEVKSSKQIGLEHFRKPVVLKVIDTPGFGDVDLKEDDYKTIVSNAAIESSPGPHVILYVVKLEVITKENLEITEQIISHLGEDIYNFIVIVFTHGEFDDENAQREYISEVPSNFSTFIKNCENRVVAVDNNCKDSYRTNETHETHEKLIKIIFDLVEKNNYCFYTNEALQTTQNIMEEVSKNKEESILSDTYLDDSEELYNENQKVYANTIFNKVKAVFGQSYEWLWSMLFKRH